MLTIIIIVLAILLGWFIASYNGFIRLTQRAREAWADIDVQLKRRHDLIPNLVNTVKGYASHEAGVFDQVSTARSAAINATNTGLAARAAAEGELSAALGRLFAVAEAYPDLKANQNFLELQRELEDTENKIQAARRFYNTNVRDLSIKLSTFPSNLIASLFHFKGMDYFQLGDSPEDKAAREPVEVKF
ncbi:MAG TPA: LemA family protein [Candidatus Paceibacterota bacterium]|nr:LemA family protein [Candidatus Paceibacterota bacterium]